MSGSQSSGSDKRKRKREEEEEEEEEEREKTEPRKESDSTPGFEWRVEGCVCLVTGASSGIGCATVVRLLQKGASTVYVTARSGKQVVLNAIVEEAANLGGSKAKEEIRAKLYCDEPAQYVKYIRADVQKESDVKTLRDEVIHGHNRLDLLVHSAGVLKTNRIDDASAEEWDYNMNINARSSFLLIHHFGPIMRPHKGCIIVVSSVNGQQSFENCAAYCASKAAVDMLVKCSALDLAPDVRVNTINPGVVRTNLHRNSGMSEEAYSQFLERAKVTHPLGRIGEPYEIADAILFLASSTWITGANLLIDGGRVCLGAR